MLRIDSKFVICIALFQTFAVGENSECKKATFSEIPLDVCHVLQNLQKYRNHIIQIRASLDQGLRPGATCPSRLVTADYTWPDAIAAEPLREEIQSDECAPRVSGELPIREFLDLRRSKQQSSGKRIIATGTFTGRLLAREQYVRVTTNYGLLANGYGHLGAFPAAIELSLVRDVEWRIDDQPAENQNRARE